MFFILRTVDDNGDNVTPMFLRDFVPFARDTLSPSSNETRQLHAEYAVSLFAVFVSARFFASLGLISSTDDNRKVHRAIGLARSCAIPRTQLPEKQIPAFGGKRLILWTLTSIRSGRGANQSKRRAMRNGEARNGYGCTVNAP